MGAKDHREGWVLASLGNGAAWRLSGTGIFIAPDFGGAGLFLVWVTRPVPEWMVDHPALQPHSTLLEAQIAIEKMVDDARMARTKQNGGE